MVAWLGSGSETLLLSGLSRGSGIPSPPLTAIPPAYPAMLSSLVDDAPLQHLARPPPSPPLFFPLADPTWCNTLPGPPPPLHGLVSSPLHPSVLTRCNALPGLPHDVRIGRGLVQVRRDGGEKMFQAIHAGLPPGEGGRGGRHNCFYHSAFRVGSLSLAGYSQCVCLVGVTEDNQTHEHMRMRCPTPFAHSHLEGPV